jgi:hypothetical protein
MEYLGENKKYGYYLIKSFYRHFVMFDIINKDHGSFVSFDNFPIFSPNDLYYGNVVDDWTRDKIGIEINNLSELNFDYNHKKRIKIAMPNEYANCLKWIDDSNFLFFTTLKEESKGICLPHKYYLVQIKQ